MPSTVVQIDQVYKTRDSGLGGFCLRVWYSLSTLRVWKYNKAIELKKKKLKRIVHHGEFLTLVKGSPVKENKLSDPGCAKLGELLCLQSLVGSQEWLRISDRMARKTKLLKAWGKSVSLLPPRQGLTSKHLVLHWGSGKFKQLGAGGGSGNPVWVCESWSSGRLRSLGKHQWEHQDHQN